MRHAVSGCQHQPKTRGACKQQFLKRCKNQYRRTAKIQRDHNHCKQRRKKDPRRSHATEDPLAHRHLLPELGRQPIDLLGIQLRGTLGLEALDGLLTSLANAFPLEPSLIEAQDPGAIAFGQRIDQDIGSDHLSTLAPLKPCARPLPDGVSTIDHPTGHLHPRGSIPDGVLAGLRQSLHPSTRFGPPGCRPLERFGDLLDDLPGSLQSDLRLTCRCFRIEGKIQASLGDDAVDGRKATIALGNPIPGGLQPPNHRDLEIRQGRIDRVGKQRIALQLLSEP